MGYRMDIRWVIESTKDRLWDQQKMGLTHYQTTDFIFFQTERVCRRQFQI